ncbi:unnamed protein product [Lampetra fluviatilis]
MVASSVTRHVDLPGTELAQLMGEMDPRLPGSTATAFLRSLPFLRKKRMTDKKFDPGTNLQWPRGWLVCIPPPLAAAAAF